MKRIWGHVLVSGLAAGAAVALSSACAHDDSTIFIRNVLFPPNAQAGGACTYTGDPSQPELAEGLLDVGVSKLGDDSYQGVFLIGNQMIPRGDPNQVRTETSRVIIQGAIVRLTDAFGGGVPGGSSFTTLGTGAIDPAQGTTPSYSPAFFTIIPPATSSALRQTLALGDSTHVVSFIRAFGQTLGGQHVESNEFQFPITVCNGCLVSFPAAANDPAQKPNPNCLSVSSTTIQAAPCRIGQDQPVDCRICQTNPPTPACGPQSTGPADAGGG